MSSKNEFSDRERQLMAFAWQCFDGEPKVDYKKLADLVGMTNPASASNAWAKIKKKIQAQAEEGGAIASGGEGTPKPKATPGKKRAKAAADQDEDESPTKKAKPAKGGKAKNGKKAGSESPVKPEPTEDD